MPIPKPKKDEKRAEFISRCMGNPTMVKEYEQRQRSAICYQTWRDKDKNQANEELTDNGPVLVLVANIDTTQVRSETLNGRNYKVAPVVMIVEGVLNDWLYPAEEISKFVEAWNGRPVTLFHPKNGEGEYISANSPNVEESIHLGKLYGSIFEDSRLKSEVWLDVERTQSIRPEVLEYFNGSQEKLEVSTGLWGDLIMTNGTWQGKQYKGIMKNIRPDHLALLPGGEGACNWTDGCGLRGNETEEGEMTEIYKVLKSMFVNSALTDRELSDALRRAIDALDNSQWVNYIEDFISSENVVFYRADPRPSGDGGASYGVGKLYRRSYTVDSNGQVQLAAEKEEVRKKVTYVKVNETEKEGEKRMNKEEKVNALIACQRCRFEEKDREFLMNMSEEQLELVTPPDNVVVKPETTSVANEPEKPPQTALSAFEWITQQESMPSEVRETLSEALALNQAQRAEMVGKILKHPKNLFTQEQLQAKPNPELKAILALAEQAQETPTAPEAKPETVTPEAAFNYGMRLFGRGTGEEGKDKDKPTVEPLKVYSLADKFAEKNK